MYAGVHQQIMLQGTNNHNNNNNNAVLRWLTRTCVVVIEELYKRVASPIITCSKGS